MVSIRSWRNRLAGGTAAAVIGIGLGACGKSSTSSPPVSATSPAVASSACSLAKKDVASYSAPFSLPASLPSVNASKLKGKTIAAVYDTLTNPVDVENANGFKAAAASVGASVSEFNGQGSPVDQTDAMVSAVSEKPLAIATWAIVSSSISYGLATAKKAGVPVMMGYPGIPAAAPGYWTQFAAQKSGVVGAEMAFTDAGCNPHAEFGLLTTPLLTNVNVDTSAFSTKMGQICPSCKIYTEVLSLTNLATTAGPDAVGMVQAHPGISVVLASIAPALLNVDPALTTAGFNKVKVIGLAGHSHSNDKYIQSGQESDLANPSNPVLGWINFDQLVRQVAQVPAYNTWENVPTVILSKADFSEVHPSLTPSNYQALFEKAWGVAK